MQRKDATDAELFAAIWANDIAKIVQYCSENPGVVNTVRSDQGFSPLRLAIGLASVSAVQALLASPGIKVSLQDIKLTLDLLNTHEKIYKLVCKKAGQAAARGIFDVISQNDLEGLNKVLLENPGDVLNDQNKSGNTPLCHAINMNNKMAVKLLLDYGAEVNQANRDGNTPLMCAIELGYVDIVEMLIANCAVKFELRNKAGQSAFDLAEENCMFHSDGDEGDRYEDILGLLNAAKVAIDTLEAVDGLKEGKSVRFKRNVEVKYFRPTFLAADRTSSKETSGLAFPQPQRPVFSTTLTESTGNVGTPDVAVPPRPVTPAPEVSSPQASAPTGTPPSLPGMMPRSTLLSDSPPRKGGIIRLSGVHATCFKPAGKNFRPVQVNQPLRRSGRPVDEQSGVATPTAGCNSVSRR